MNDFFTNKKGGLVLSTLILAVVFSVGFYFGASFMNKVNGNSQVAGSEEEVIEEINEENLQLSDIEPIVREMLAVESVCESVGGKWDKLGSSVNASFVCNTPTKDAGRFCSDSSQCESYCKTNQTLQEGSIAPGICHEWKYAECIQEVKDGMARPFTCN